MEGFCAPSTRHIRWPLVYNSPSVSMVHVNIFNHKWIALGGCSTYLTLPTWLWTISKAMGPTHHPHSLFFNLSLCMWLSAWGNSGPSGLWWNDASFFFLWVAFPVFFLIGESDLQSDKSSSTTTKGTVK